MNIIIPPDSRGRTPSEIKIGSRLQRLNGWRRLWLVATAAAALWFVVVWPLLSLRDVQSGEYDYRREIEKEFASGQCRIYQTEPFEKLREPGLNDGCWYIYEDRKYDKDIVLPYTLEAYKSKKSAYDREQYLIALSVGVAGTAIASGLVYFLGWLVGWILTGFRQH
jgi:hypothetical protein